MENYSRYWKTFKLSISGWVMVSKTYLLSQATYLMGIIPLPVDKAMEMNRIIIEYVNGGERMLAHDKNFYKGIWVVRDKWTLRKWICIKMRTGSGDG